MSLPSFLTLWNLTADGAPIVTHSSELLPARLMDGTAAMLKVATHPEEIFAGGLMVWWDGDGAAAMDPRLLLALRGMGAGRRRIASGEIVAITLNRRKTVR